MADAFTAKLNLTKPEVGASTDTWGTKLNADLDTIDGLFDTGPYLKVANGGTGAGTAANARTNLGLGSLATLNTVSATEISSDAVTTAKILDANVTTAKIADANVTTAKLADGAVSGAKIAMGSDAQGDVLYYNGTTWVRLAAGTAGQVLTTGGASANPSWASAITMGTEQASTSGSAITFSSIPTTAKRITVSLAGVTASSNVYVRVGDSGGTITTGYSAASFDNGGNSSSSTEFLTRNSSGSGIFTITKISSTKYAINGVFADSGTSGSVPTSDEVITVVIGTNGTFSAGTINIMYE